MSEDKSKRNEDVTKAVAMVLSTLGVPQAKQFTDETIREKKLENDLKEKEIELLSLDYRIQEENLKIRQAEAERIRLSNEETRLKLTGPEEAGT